MNSDLLTEKFHASVSKVNTAETPLAVDTMLKLYALYKIATNNQQNPSGDAPYISAFKANALFQAKHLNKEEAMKAYIDIVSEQLGN